MMTILLVSSMVAIVVSFCCSLAEALLLSLNPLTLNRLQARHARAAESWRRLKRNVARPITAILVLNTVAHTGGATVAGGAFAEIYGERNIWIFSVLFTFVVLFVTEILPKIIGVTFRNQLAPATGPILEGFTRLLHPVIRLSEAMFRRLTRETESEQITTADLVTLATLARSGKAINLEQENIIVNAVRLSHVLLDSSMIPAVRIRFVNAREQPAVTLELLRQGNHTRYPVSLGPDPAGIHAYIVVPKATPLAESDLERLLAAAKPIRTVGHRATLMTALQVMLRNREHLLAVVNEAGACIGMVTLEDIAAELLSADIQEFR